MSRKVVILGGGTGGTLIANRLRRVLGRGAAEIVVIDPDDEHVYQPGLLFVPFGKVEPDSLIRPRHRQFRSGVTFRQAAVDRVGPGWKEKVHTFYTLDGAAALRRALVEFDGGRLVVAVMDMPIKCPVAPLEFCFLADAYFRERGIRDKVNLTYVTPLDGAFTKPVCNRELSGLLKDKGVSLVTEFNTGEVDGAGRRLVSFDGREVPFDLAVVVPLHGGQAYIERSPGLGDELGFVPTDQRTLQSKARQGTVPMIVSPAAGERVNRAVDAMDETIREIRAAIFALQTRETERAFLRRRGAAACAISPTAPRT